MAAMTDLDQRTQGRVGELAACPLDRKVADEIRSLITTSLRRSGASSSSGGTHPKSRRTQQKVAQPC